VHGHPRHRELSARDNYDRFGRSVSRATYLERMRLDRQRNSARVVGRASLFRNTGFVVAADLIFSLGRAFTFFLLALAIGATELGRYAALLGMTQLVYPVAQWGIAHVAVRNFSRGRPFAGEWSKAVTVMVPGGLLGSAASVLIAGVLFDVSASTVLLIALAQLIGLGLQQAGGMAAAAHGRAEVALVINAANTAFRVGAILIFYFMISDQTVDTWARFLAVSMIGGSLATVTIVRVALDGRLRITKPERRDLRLGSGFVFVAAANTVQADVDKVVLGGYGLLEDNGVYAAAYRVADLASLPLTALVKASYAEFFHRGSASVTESVRYARKLTTVSVSYGLAAGGLLWIAAPVLKTSLASSSKNR